MTRKQVHNLMLVKVKTSCLSPKHAARLKLAAYAEGHALPIQPSWAGFKLPYFDLKGKALPFFRFRFTQVKPSSGFRALAEPPEKPLRYTQPAGTQPYVYFPPLLPCTWEEIAANPQAEVVITEGELKAACGCVHGIATLGLGGVFNWRSAKLGQPMLPVLEHFVWKARKVCLAFDSDAATNPMVRMAAARLGAALVERGAVMSEITLPPPNDKGDGKMGMDDFIYLYGIEEFGKLLVKATPLSNSLALHQLNLEVAVVKSTAELVQLETGQVMTARNFTEVLYKNRNYYEAKPDPADEARLSLRPRYTAKEWIAWPHRNTVNNLVYAPGLPRLTTGGDYNLWKGWGCEPSPEGTLDPWLELVERLFSGATPEHLQWFKRWLAYPLRYPGAKLASAVLIWGVAQGTGKTLLGETMAEIYGANYRAINSGDLASAYNDWVVGHQFIVGDEISVGGQGRKIADNLKDIITRPTAVVNLKYRAQFTVRDCNNYYFTSNHAEALFLEDADRRYFIHEVTAPPLPAALYKAYTRWLRKEGGASRLFYYLKQELDLGRFDPLEAPPVTQSKQDMITENRSELDAWCATLKDTPAALLRAAGAALPYSLYTAKDLHRLFDPDNSKRYTTNAISRALRRAGLAQAAHGDNHILVDAARVRLWAVREPEKYARASPALVQAAYLAERDAVKVRGGLNNAAKKKERVM